MAPSNDEPAGSGAQAHVSYSTPLPLWKQRRFARWVIGTATPLLIIACFFLWRASVGPAWHRWEERREAKALWEQCLPYTRPADQVVYEEDLSQARLLLQDSAHYQALNWAGTPPPLRAAARRPPDLQAALLDQGHYNALAWETTTLFFHELNNPQLHEHMLMILELESTLAGVKDSKNIWSFDYTEILLTPPGDLGWRGMKYELLVPRALNNPAQTTVRFFAGQPDPADAAHFILPYAVNDEPGIIDGWTDPMSQLVLKVRTGPALVK